jgi:hypothetical protein
MRRRTTRGAALLGAAWSLAGACPALATATALRASSDQVSDNWAGYAVTANRPFRRVVGAWVQPRARCETAQPRYSAFWVGLGGFTARSDGLEQIGTEADCAKGHASYYAWYELLPAEQVVVSFKVHAGDHMTASVTVSGDGVALHLHDLSTGTSFGRTVRMHSPDTSSAEWIAEAPSQCASGARRCQTLPLADFSSVTFYGATASTPGAPMSPIDSAAFHATKVTLKGGGAELGTPGHAIVSTSGAQATPSTLADSGSSFSIAWEQRAAPQTPAPNEPFLTAGRR